MQHFGLFGSDLVLKNYAKYTRVTEQFQSRNFILIGLFGSDLVLKNYAKYTRVTEQFQSRNFILIGLFVYD